MGKKQLLCDAGISLAAWPSIGYMGLKNLTQLKENTTRFPVIIEELIPAGITEGSVESKSI